MRADRGLSAGTKAATTAVKYFCENMLKRKGFIWVWFIEKYILYLKILWQIGATSKNKRIKFTIYIEKVTTDTHTHSSSYKNPWKTLKYLLGSKWKYRIHKLFTWCWNICNDKKKQKKEILFIWLRNKLCREQIQKNIQKINNEKSRFLLMSYQMIKINENWLTKWLSDWLTECRQHN